jgi:hypothetical protein
MKGPLHAIRRKRSERAANDPNAEQATAEQAEARFGKDATDAPTTVQRAAEPAPTSEVPAGQEPAPARPSFRERGRLRRRLRYLRRVRELGFRDLGGLVFDQHKFARVNDELLRGKLAALAGVDRELRAIEHVLDDRRPITELREPGISVCPRCGGLHGSEARYCPSCGVPVHGALAIAEVGEAVSIPAGEPTPHPSTPPPPAQPAVPEPEAQPAATNVAEREATKAQPASDGEQPTQTMEPVEHEPANGAVPQSSGERREP